MNRNRSVTSVFALSGPALVAVLSFLGVLLAFAPEASAWNFSSKSCVSAKQNRFSKSQPQVYLMLDRSGSMGGNTSIQSCPTCQYSYKAGKKVQTKTVRFNRSGDRETVSFTDGSSGGGSPKTLTKPINRDGDDLQFNFSGLVAGPGSRVPVTVELWGDLDWSGEYANVYADGAYQGNQCNNGACRQCSSSPATKKFYVPMSYLNDGRLRIDVRLSRSVNDFCSKEQVRVTIPGKYTQGGGGGVGGVSGHTQAKAYSRTGEDVRFNFQNMQTRPGSTFPMTVQLTGDYNWSHEYADIYADGRYLGTQCRSGCDQCRNQPHSKTFQVPMWLLSDGRLNVEVRNSANVHKLCTAKVRVAIPKAFFTTGGGSGGGGFGASSCVGVQFDTWGDYGSSSEYANVSLDGKRMGQICRGGGCRDCGGPYTATYEPTKQMTQDGHLYATIDNSRWVNTFCRRDEAKISLTDHSGGSLASGSYSCLNCAVKSDCKRNLPVPDCAVQSVSLSQQPCNASASKWSVAEGSLNTVVGDMTKANPDEAEFGLGLFTSRAWNEVTPQENAASKIKSALNSNSPSGGTDLRDAINKSSSVLSSAGSNRIQASVLVTDGIHGGDDTDVIQAACRHRNNRGKLFVVGFAGGTDPAFNNAVAAAGGTGTCCLPGTGNANCTPSSGKVVDPCSLSESQLHQYRDGRQLDCSGANQANNGVALKSAISTIASDLSCTVDVSKFGGQKWSDPYYGCAPEYDCFKIQLPGISQRIYHVNSANSPKGWKWSNPSRQKNIVLNSKWCKKVKGLTDNRVVTKRACMCSKPKGGSCPYSRAKQCGCKRGTWSCNQGFDSCSQHSFANCPPGQLKGEGGSCSAGQGVCRTTGKQTCRAKQSLVCSAQPDDTQKTAEKCDGLDNDCDGQVDEDKGVEVCDGKDNDCDGKIDEGTSKTCNTGLPGRCSAGRKSCQKGVQSSCDPIRRPVPEICNGLDDNCDGIVDNIQQSWDGTTKVTLADKKIACGTTGACVCDPGDADTKHRGTKKGKSKQKEFDEMVSNTQTTCTCSE